MNSIPTDIEQMTLDAAKRLANVLMEALIDCCNERNKLDPIQKTPGYYIHEVINKT